MRVVLDTNIFVSGIHWKGIPSRIIDALDIGKFESVTSDEILDEFVKVMKEFKITLPVEKILLWENFIITKSEIVIPKEDFKAVKDDPKDDKFVNAAVEGKCDYIVSKDKKHLLKLKEFSGIKIIPPEEFIILLDSE